MDDVVAQLEQVLASVEQALSAVEGGTLSELSLGGGRHGGAAGGTSADITASTRRRRSHTTDVAQAGGTAALPRRGRPRRTAAPADAEHDPSMPRSPLPAAGTRAAAAAGRKARREASRHEAAEDAFSAAAAGPTVPAAPATPLRPAAHSASSSGSNGSGSLQPSNGLLEQQPAQQPHAGVALGHEALPVASSSSGGGSACAVVVDADSRAREMRERRERREAERSMRAGVQAGVVGGAGSSGGDADLAPPSLEPPQPPQHWVHPELEPLQPASSSSSSPAWNGGARQLQADLSAALMKGEGLLQRLGGLHVGAALALARSAHLQPQQLAALLALQRAGQLEGALEAAGQLAERGFSSPQLLEELAWQVGAAAGTIDTAHGLVAARLPEGAGGTEGEEELWQLLTRVDVARAAFTDMLAGLPGEGGAPGV